MRYRKLNVCVDDIKTVSFSILKNILDFYHEIQDEVNNIDERDSFVGKMYNSYLGCEYNTIETYINDDQGTFIGVEKYLDIPGPYCWLRVRDNGEEIFLERIVQIVLDNDCEVLGYCRIEDLNEAVESKGGSTATFRE